MEKTETVETEKVEITETEKGVVQTLAELTLEGPKTVEKTEVTETEKRETVEK